MPWAVLPHKTRRKIKKLLERNADEQTRPKVHRANMFFLLVALRNIWWENRGSFHQLLCQEWASLTPSPHFPLTATLQLHLNPATVQTLIKQNTQDHRAVAISMMFSNSLHSFFKTPEPSFHIKLYLEQKYLSSRGQT